MDGEVEESSDGRAPAPPRFGPGFIVAAAFVGPGTVTTASVAGARYGLALLWTVLFAVLASVVLQEMAARLGLVSGAGLGQALRRTFRAPWSRAAAVGLVLLAVGAGNAAFEVGNVTGAALGIGELTGAPRPAAAAAVALGAWLLMASGRYRSIERGLGALVAVMALLFVATAVMARPDPHALWEGASRPTLPEGSLLTVIALIGTTVVPYNLFLHASAAAEKWRGVPAVPALRAARIDTALSIALGGVVTASIMVAAAAIHAPGTEIETAGAMARQLEPALGASAEMFFLLGLLAAGVTSAATAPLAAAYAAGGCLGWPGDLRDPRMRRVGVAVLGCGAALAVWGHKPLAVIVGAQALNGLLLPLIALFLLIASNQAELLGGFRNRFFANVGAGLVVTLTFVLAAWQLLRAWAAL